MHINGYPAPAIHIRIRERTAVGESTKRYSVLIVDDEPSVLKALQRLLRDEDYQVHTAASYEEAMGWLDRQPFAVVLSDYKMPGVPGDELLAIVMKKQPKAVRMMLTGAAYAKAPNAAITEGVLHCQVFLAKPWNDDELVATLRHGVACYDNADREHTDV